MTIFESLSLPRDYQFILEKQGLVEEVEQLLALEQYGLVTRNEIVAFLNEEHILTQFSSVNYIDRHSDFSSLETKYGILIDAQNSSALKLTVYYPYGLKVSQEEIDIRLNSFQIEYVVLTPFNFKQLAEEQLVWDVVLEYKCLVLFCVRHHITDLHFDTIHKIDGTHQVVRGRYGNQLVNLTQFSFEREEIKEMILRLVLGYTSANTDDLDLPEGIDTSIVTVPSFFEETEAVLRMRAMPVLDGYCFVTRIQTATTAVLTIEQLGFNQRQTRDLIQVASKDSGLTLIGGAMRVGKNTTAFALLRQKMKSNNLKICSYEHPIEYLLPITQIDFKGDSTILRDLIEASKRLDLDVAYVNEIPSAGVAAGIQDLVNSSVGVITSLHVNRVWHVPYKLLEYFGSEYKNVISQISGIFVQMMFEFLCPECRVQRRVEEIPDSFSDVREFLTSKGVETVYDTRGCAKCLDQLTGRKGYLPGYARPRMEHLVFDNELRSKLTQCEAPYQMEQLLKEVIQQKKQSFEFTLLDEISNGTFHYSVIRSIL